MADTRQVLADALDEFRHSDSFIRGFAAEVDFVIAYLAKHNVALIEDDGSHWMDSRPAPTDENPDRVHWTIQHPAKCRPDLLSCPMTQMVEDWWATIDGGFLRHSTNRYRVSVTDEGEISVVLRNRD